MKPTTEQPYIIRYRISHEMAFPAGYELLREHFGTSADWSEARFLFRDRPTTFASEFTRILRAREPYCILCVEFGAKERAGSHLPAHWHFTVYPVPRELKSIARSALVTQSFDPLRSFIATAPTHSNYYNRTDVIFDPAEGTCRTEQLWEI